MYVKTADSGRRYVDVKEVVKSMLEDIEKEKVGGATNEQPPEQLDYGLLISFLQDFSQAAGFKERAGIAKELKAYIQGLVSSALEEAGRGEKKSGKFGYVKTDSRIAIHYMIVTYECGCDVRSTTDASLDCPEHHKGIKRVARITEYVNNPIVRKA